MGQESADQTMRERVRELYDAFAGYRPEEVDPRTPPPLQELWRKPLRDLMAPELHEIVNPLIHEFGTVTDLKYFLPRYLELSAFLHDEVDLFILFRKCVWQGWDEWPARERAAVGAYLLERWRADLPAVNAANWGEALLLVAGLEHVAILCRDLRPFLEALRAAAGVYVGYAVARELVVYGEDILDHLAEASRGHTPSGREQLEAWVRDPRTGEWLQGILGSTSAGSLEQENVRDALRYREQMVARRGEGV